MASKKDMRSFICLRSGNRPKEIVEIALENFNEGVNKALNVKSYDVICIGEILETDLYMLVNKKRLLNGSELNRTATFLHGHGIFGDALLCTVDDSFNFCPVEGSDFFMLNRLLR